MKFTILWLILTVVLVILIILNYKKIINWFKGL